jgi:diguanylate cyclase (GGDEF)-like protein/PAS domain S-box-containing protein
LRVICQKIISHPYLLALAGGGAVFIVILFTFNLPAQIAIGEKGQHAIKMLDAVRRQFLEIKKEETLLIWTDNITRPTTSELHKAIEMGNALFASYRQSAEYNPELLRQAIKLSEAYGNWIQREQRLFELFQKMSADEHANGVNAQILMDMNTASAMFLYVTRQLSEAGGLIAADIERGRQASHLLILSMGSLSIYLISLVFLQQRFRKLELESQIDARTRDLNEANKNIQQELLYRKQSEEAIRIGKERLGIMFQTSASAIICLSSTHKIIELNNEAERLYGIKREEALGKDYFELFLPKSVWEKVASDIRKVLLGEPARGHETPIITRDRGERKVNWSVSRIPIEEGQFGVMAIGQDITERRNAEKALKISEQMHRLVLDNISEIIYMIKTTADDQFGGDVIFVSSRVKNFLGYEPQEFERNPNLWLGLVHPDDIPALKDATQDIFITKRPGTRIYRIRHKDSKEYRWMEDSMVPQIDHSGNIIGIFGVARDTTEQKKSEEALFVSEEKFRMLAQQSITGTCIIQDDRFLYVNPYLADMLDYQQEEMHGLKVLDLVAERDMDMVKENMLRRMSGEMPYLRYTFHALKKGGSEVTVEVYGSAMKYLGRPAIMATVLDITERENAEAEIKNTISLLNATLESTTDGILVVNREGKMVSFNKRFVTMWHIPESIVNSRDDNQALAFVLKQLKNPEAFLTKVRELYSQPYAESFDVLEFKDARVFERFSRPQLIGEESVGRVWSFWDVTERRRAEEKIKHMAYHDPLTDLPNRSLFYDRLQQAILCGKREAAPLCLMFLDMVDFKKVNDTYGHHCGDMLLKQLGQRLRGVLRESDTVARIGGDEFAIILLRPEKIEGAVRTAGKIIEAIGAPFSLNETTLNVTVSIGIVLYPEHGEDIDMLTQRADTAMYAAKRSGKGFVVHGS